MPENHIRPLLSAAPCKVEGHTYVLGEAGMREATLEELAVAEQHNLDRMSALRQFEKNTDDIPEIVTSEWLTEQIALCLASDEKKSIADILTPGPSFDGINYLRSLVLLLISQGRVADIQSCAAMLSVPPIEGFRY